LRDEYVAECVMKVSGSRCIHISFVKIVYRKALTSPQRVVVTSAVLGNMRCSLEPNEQISWRTGGEKGWCGWGREIDDVACGVVARYVLWVVERDWWAWHYTGRVAVTSYGAANEPSLGIPTTLILCGPRALTERQSSPQAVTPVWIRWVIAYSLKCNASLGFQDSV
jgi:hypothetical protein